MVRARVNKTTFEHSKTYAQIFSRKPNPIDPYGMMFLEHHEVEVVGVQKLTYGPMVDGFAKKARKRLAALVRLKPMLDSGNLKTMHTMFVRSIMEYGSIAWMGAADTDLKKLDRVQAAAEKVGGFTVEALGVRREAVAVEFSLKLTTGETRGVLKDFIPAIQEVKAPNSVYATVRSKQYGWLLPSYKTYFTRLVQMKFLGCAAQNMVYFATRIGV